MEPIGAGANASLARRPAIVTRGGLRIAFLGYSDVNPAGFPATTDLPGTAAADPATITADVHAACAAPTSPSASSTGASSCTPGPTRARRSLRRLPARGRVTRARRTPARLRPRRAPHPAHARRVDARQLRLPLRGRDGAHRHPPGELGADGVEGYRRRRSPSRASARWSVSETFTRCPRRCGLRTKFPLRAARFRPQVRRPARLR